MRDFSLIYLNGVRREIPGQEGLMMLAEWLRKEAGMPGTKIVCAEGDCGACTVLRAMPCPRSSPNSSSDSSSDSSLGASLRFDPINSCIATVAQMDGSHIVTVEGIQNGPELSPVQKTMMACNGSQCGYCTPGFVMALSGMLEVHDSVDAKTAKNYLTGNLCRCTGYQPIIDAAVAARASKDHSVAGRYLNEAATRELLAVQKKSLTIQSPGITNPDAKANADADAAGACLYFAPATLREAVTFAALNPGFRVLGAATDIGVQINKGKPLPQAILSLHLIPELYDVKKNRGGITVGARVTLAQLRRESESLAPEFSRFLDLFASPQIKNVATLAGNIANASPIGDTLPFLLIAGGIVHLASRPSGKGPVKKRVVPMTEFYLGYKKLAIDPGEIITHVSFDKTPTREILRLYKTSQRKDLDISAVSAAFAVTTSGRGAVRVVESARIAFGGVAATPIRVPVAEDFLVGLALTPELIENTAQLISHCLEPLSDARGTAAYRRVLAANLFRRYCAEVLHG